MCVLCLIWRMMYARSGIRLKDLMTFANDKSNIQPSRREANIKGMAAHLGSIFKHRYSFGKDHQFHKHRFLRIMNLRFYESYLCFLYLGIKCLYLINVIFQVSKDTWFYIVFIDVSNELVPSNWSLCVLRFRGFGWSVQRKTVAGIGKLSPSHFLW